jgi:hypothetical protein
VWGTFLSEPRRIGALVRRYRTNKLILRMPVFYRPKALIRPRCRGRIPWGINPGFPGLSPCKRWVAYALRTRAPLSSRPKPGIPYDLHVLGLPLAFILSQDQTLHCKVSVGRALMHGLMFLFGSLSRWQSRIATDVCLSSLHYFNELVPASGLSRSW